MESIRPRPAPPVVSLSDCDKTRSMASVTAHVLLGTPRRFGEGLSPEFLAMFREAAEPRWQVESLEPRNRGPRRTVVWMDQGSIALGLAVAIHSAIDSPFLSAIVEPRPRRDPLRLSQLDDDTLEIVERTIRQNPAALSAVVCWQQASSVTPEVVDAVIPYLTGDVHACTTVWSQVGSGHDGFGTPGQRFINPDWTAGPDEEQG